MVFCNIALSRLACNANLELILLAFPVTGFVCVANGVTDFI